MGLHYWEGCNFGHTDANGYISIPLVQRKMNILKNWSMHSKLSSLRF